MEINGTHGHVNGTKFSSQMVMVSATVMKIHFVGLINLLLVSSSVALYQANKDLSLNEKGKIS